MGEKVKEVVLEENEQKENVVIEYYEKGKSWFMASLGFIIMVVGIVSILLIASLEGTKEVRASSRVSGSVLVQWRMENDVEEGFPEERVDVIVYGDKNKEYYYIEDILENGDVDWYFAFDSDLDYVFGDYKYYLMTALAIIIAMFVSYVNYNSQKKTAKEQLSFKKSLSYYQKIKDKIKPFTHLISDFCAFKNKQFYDNEVRNIVEQAGVIYHEYLDKDFNYDDLKKWQLKKLKKIEKIKMTPLISRDLLQEVGLRIGSTKPLPMGEGEHQAKFLISGFFQKLVLAGLSGTIVAFGVVLGNWFVGIGYAMTILISYIVSIVVASDYVGTTLRNRYITKGDYLIEFDNIKDTFVVVPKISEKIENIV